MIPLFTSDQVRSADNYAISKLGIPGIVLMENASLSIYKALRKSFPELIKELPIGIVAGKGNNGGDAFALARHLFNAHFNVIVFYLADEKELKGDALINFKILKKLSSTNRNLIVRKYKKVSDLNLLNDCQLIIDGLLGTGAKGELKEPIRSIVEKVNEINTNKLAIDIPTGLDVDSGYGDMVFDADVTVTLAEMKRGLFFGKGYTHSGDVYKGSIGLGDEYFTKLNVVDYLIEPEDCFVGIPERKLDAHKYSAGKVLVIAGSDAYPGAAKLTANSAIVSGAGAVILAVPDSIHSIVHPGLEGVVVESYPSSGYFDSDSVAYLRNRIEWADVIAIGPGLGRDEETLSAVLEITSKFSHKKFVIDADALYAFGKSDFKKLSSSNFVFTPHAGEFSSMMKFSRGELNRDILASGRKFINFSKGYLLLKGAPTVIFNPVGEAFINTSGNPGLAKFGTGDVLTGLISAFIAQSGDIEKSLVSACYIHGLAADLYSEDFSEINLTAERLIDYIPNAVKFVHDTFV